MKTEKTNKIPEKLVYALYEQFDKDIDLKEGEFWAKYWYFDSDQKKQKKLIKKEIERHVPCAKLPFPFALVVNESLELKRTGTKGNLTVFTEVLSNNNPGQINEKYPKAWEKIEISEKTSLLKLSDAIGDKWENLLKLPFCKEVGIAFSIFLYLSTLQDELKEIETEKETSWNGLRLDLIENGFVTKADKKLFDMALNYKIYPKDREKIVWKEDRREAAIFCKRFDMENPEFNKCFYLEVGKGRKLHKTDFTGLLADKEYKINEILKKHNK